MGTVLASEPMIAAAVSRVSLELQVDNFSLKAQHARIEELCRQHHLVVPPEYLLDDGGYSGSNFNRPAFRKAVQLVREGKAQVVLFPYVDRFSRASVEAGLRTIRELREAGAKVVLGEIGPITDDAHCIIVLSTLLGISQAQRSSIIMKSKAGVLQKIREGHPHSGRLPFGFHQTTRAEQMADDIRAGNETSGGRFKSRMVRVEKEISVLKLMAELINGGSSLRAIARELTARGIPTRLRGKGWSPNTVKQILHDDVYSSGTWYYNKRAKVEVKRDSWRNLSEDGKHWAQKLRPRSEWVGLPIPGGAIWTKAEHLALREQLSKNGRAVNGKPAAPHGREAMLKSLTICRACGKAVTMWQKSRENGRRDAWYKCSHRNRIGPGFLCTAAKSINAELLESSIWNAWRDCMTVELPQRVSQYFDELRREAGDQGSEALRSQRAKLAKTRQAAMDKEIEADSEEDRLYYANRVTTMKAEIALLDRRIAAAEMTTPSINVASVQREMLKIAGTNDPRVKREALLATVDKILWAGDSTADEADVFLRVPVANRARGVCDIDSYIPLKIKVKLAA